MGRCVFGRFANRPYTPFVCRCVSTIMRPRDLLRTVVSSESLSHARTGRPCQGVPGARRFVAGWFANRPNYNRLPGKFSWTDPMLARTVPDSLRCTANRWDAWSPRSKPYQPAASMTSDPPRAQHYGNATTTIVSSATTGRCMPQVVTSSTIPRNINRRSGLSPQVTPAPSARSRRRRLRRSA